MSDYASGFAATGERSWVKAMLARPWRLVLWALVIGLPLHTFVMMVLVGPIGLLGRVVTVLSAWKELLALGTATILLSLIALRAFQDGAGGWRMALARARAAVTWLDGMVALFALWVLVRAAWSLKFGSPIPVSAQLYGLRFYLVPLALYVIGRIVLLTPEQFRRLLWALTIMGGVTGAIAVIERALPNDLFIRLIGALGYQRYFIGYLHAFINGPQQTAASMWLATGANTVRRAGSLYMVSKPFALTYLVIVPAALLLLMRETRLERRRWLQVCLVLSWADLICSLTRLPIIACALILVGMLVQFRRKQPLYGLLLGAVLAVVSVGVGTYTSSLTRSSGRDLSAALSGTDASTTEHASVWTAALHAATYYPVTGWGVGTANEDTTRIVRTTKEPITLGAEDVFLQVLEELGLIGLLLTLGMFGGFLWRSWHLSRGADLVSSDVGTVMLWSTLGVLVVGITTPLWSGAFVLTYFYWWLAGQTVATEAVALRATATQTVGSPIMGAGRLAGAGE
jgi:hypothetical protein